MPSEHITEKIFGSDLSETKSIPKEKRSIFIDENPSPKKTEFKSEEKRIRFNPDGSISIKRLSEHKTRTYGYTPDTNITNHLITYLIENKTTSDGGKLTEEQAESVLRGLSLQQMQQEDDSLTTTEAAKKINGLKPEEVSQLIDLVKYLRPPSSKIIFPRKLIDPDTLLPRNGISLCDANSIRNAFRTDLVALHDELRKLGKVIPTNKWNVLYNIFTECNGQLTATPITEQNMADVYCFLKQAQINKEKASKSLSR